MPFSSSHSNFQTSNPSQWSLNYPLRTYAKDEQLAPCPIPARCTNPRPVAGLRGPQPPATRVIPGSQRRRKLRASRLAHNPSSGSATPVASGLRTQNQMSSSDMDTPTKPRMLTKRGLHRGSLSRPALAFCEVSDEQPNQKRPREDESSRGAELELIPTSSHTSFTCLTSRGNSDSIGATFSCGQIGVSLLRASSDNDAPPVASPSDNHSTERSSLTKYARVYQVSSTLSHRDDPTAFRITEPVPQPNVGEMGTLERERTPETHLTGPPRRSARIQATDQASKV